MTTRTPQAAPISSTIDPGGWLLMVPGTGGALARVPASTILQPGPSLNLHVESITFPNGTVARSASAFIGARGATGQQGQIGNTGSVGPQGATGPSITTIIDNGVGTITVVYDNGYTSNIGYPYSPPSTTGGDNPGGAGGDNAP